MKTREEVIALVDAAKEFRSEVREQARAAVMLLPEAELEKVSALIEKGMPLLQAGNVDGLIDLLKEAGFPAVYRVAARTILNAANIDNGYKQ